MNYDHQTSKRLIFGMSGSGKTTLWLRLLEASPAKYKFVFDHKLEVARKLGWQAARTMEGLCTLFDQHKPVVFYPGDWDDLDAAFSFFCQFTRNLSEIKNGVKLFAADELQDFTDVQFSRLPAPFRWMLNNGRMQELDLLLAAQSLNYVNSRIRFQCTELFIFKHSETANFDMMREAGIDPEGVKALPHPKVDNKVGYIYRNALTGKTQRVIHALNP